MARDCCTDISVDKNWSKCLFSPCSKDQLRKNRFSEERVGGIRSLSCAASYGSFEAASPLLKMKSFFTHAWLRAMFLWEEIIFRGGGSEIRRRIFIYALLLPAKGAITTVGGGGSERSGSLPWISIFSSPSDLHLFAKPWKWVQIGCISDLWTPYYRRIPEP